jgi:hypothetical protein
MNTGMTRLHGRAVKHPRVIKVVPDTRFHRTTILSDPAGRDEGPFVFEGALNGKLFRVNVAQWPAPSLKPGGIVVMDNFVKP